MWLYRLCSSLDLVLAIFSGDISLGVPLHHFKVVWANVALFYGALMGCCGALHQCGPVFLVCWILLVTTFIVALLLCVWLTGNGWGGPVVSAGFGHCTSSAVALCPTWCGQDPSRPGGEGVLRFVVVGCLVSPISATLF